MALDFKLKDVMHGNGLKIASDADHADDVGLFYENAATGVRSKEYAYNILQNEPKALSVSAWNVAPGASYYVVIRTQSPANHSGSMLKNVREVKSDFTVAVERGRQQEAPQPGDATPPSAPAESPSASVHDGA